MLSYELHFLSVSLNVMVQFSMLSVCTNSVDDLENSVTAFMMVLVAPLMAEHATS